MFNLIWTKVKSNRNAFSHKSWKTYPKLLARSVPRHWNLKSTKSLQMTNPRNRSNKKGFRYLRLQPTQVSFKNPWNPEDSKLLKRQTKTHPKQRPTQKCCLYFLRWCKKTLLTKYTASASPWRNLLTFWRPLDSTTSVCPIQEIQTNLKMR